MLDRFLANDKKPYPLTYFLFLGSDEEIKDCVVIYFDKYFQSATEKLYYKLSEENKSRKKKKIVESLYSFLTTSDEVEK